MPNLIAAADNGVPAGAIVLYVALVVLFVAGWWKMFEKAGEAGWKAIIPIYNVVVLMKIVGRPLWWVVLFLIPCVGIVVWVISMIDLSNSFAKRGGFAVGLIFLQPIFALILGFGGAQYTGPAGPVKNQSV